MTNPNPNPENFRLLSVKETCDLLGCGRRWLWSATNRGAIPCVRLGRSVRYRSDELRAWLDAGAPSEPGSADRVRAMMRRAGG